MAMGHWKLVLYRTAAGRCPVREYLDALPSRDAARLSHALDLRVTGPLQHRVLYFAASGRTLVLLHAFTKKTPRIPPVELETAKRRMADYQEMAEG